MDDREAPRFSAAEKKVTLWAIAIVFLLSALDQTIVATAMPRVIADLHGIALYSWVTTAYLLTSTVMVPIWGKLGDLYGRRPVLLAGIGFFLAGSWLSGLSGEFGDLPVLGGGMTQLIVFRAIQGIGGGALFTTAFAIIGDMFSPRERGRLGGLFGAVFGLASAIGPLIGGFFTQHGTIDLFGHVIAGWRWVFYLNLPLSLISLFMILVKMPNLSHEAKGRIDVVGAALIIVSSVSLLLALTFGGHTMPWTSPTVLGLLIGAAAALVAYVIAERFASDPILPLALFSNRVFWSANLASFLVAMAFMSSVAFLPLLMQLGQGLDATTSGLAMLPLTAGLMLSAMASGVIASRTGRYKALLLASMAMLFGSVYLLGRMDAGSSVLDVAWRMFLLGASLGPGQSLFTLAVQNALPTSQLGVVTSSSQFFRQIGSTMGVAIFGTLLTSRLNTDLSGLMPGTDLAMLQGMMARAGASADFALPLAARVAIASSITHVLLLGLVLVAAAALCTLLVPEVPLRQTVDRSPDERPEDGPDDRLRS